MKSVFKDIILLLKANKVLVIFFLIVFFLSIYTATRLVLSFPEAVSCQSFGLYTGQNLSNKDLEQLKTMYGIAPSKMLTFVGWSDYPFRHNKKELVRMVKHGYSPVITLEPWFYPSKVGVSLKDVINGKEDNVILSFADMVESLVELSNKTTNVTIYLRFAHEMNGNWYPWSGYENNKDPKIYKKAYIKFHDIISDKLKSKNVKFIWSVNSRSVPNRSWNRASNYYPGDEYVDVIGIDGYNWGDSPGLFTRWRSFSSIFKTELRRLTSFNKPIYITEMASAGKKKDKALWIEDFFSDLNSRYGFISSFIWFDIDKEKDWRIMSSKETKLAFIKGLKSLEVCK